MPLSPSPRHMETTWPGFDEISYLFVFGSSHSRTSRRGIRDAEPTRDRPLGCDWPGETFNESGEPNYVGHLVQKKRGKPLLVYNYANEDCTIHSVQLQVQRFIQQQPELSVPEVSKYNIGGKSLFNVASFVRPSILPRKYATSLFAIWAELADENANIDAKSAAKSLFKNALSALYGAGARHFVVFTNTPRAAPSGVNQAATQTHIKFEQNTQVWREALSVEIKDFRTWYTGVTIVLMDTWQLVDDIQKKPEDFGFAASDVTRASGGSIWMDGVHFKSAVHEHIATKVAAAMPQV